MHEAYVILAAFFAGAACTSGAYSLARSLVRHRSDGWEEEHARLEAHLEPYLRSARELVSGPVSIAAEAEQWLEGNPDA